MKPLRIITALFATALVLSVSISATPRHADHSRVQLTRAQASIDASSAWNSVCANYEFPNTGSVAMNTSFLSAWNSRPIHALTFAEAFAGIQADVSSTLGTPDPGYGDGDMMVYSIQNWPDE